MSEAKYRIVPSAVIDDVLRIEIWHEQTSEWKYLANAKTIEQAEQTIKFYANLPTYDDKGNRL